MVPRLGNTVFKTYAPQVVLVVKNLLTNAGGFNPWAGKMPWRRNGNAFQYSCLENSMDKGAWWATVHGVVRVGHDLATKQQQKGR